MRHDLDEQQRRRLSPLQWRANGVAGEGGGAKATANGEAFDDDDDENARFNACLPEGWERGLTREERIPYYLNHGDESTQWDHPAYSELMCRLLEVNSVRYSAYRLALKLRRVQQRLCLDLVDLETALFAFDEHGLTADRHDLAIQVRIAPFCLTMSFGYR